MGVMQKVSVIAIENYYDKRHLEELREKVQYVETVFPGTNSFFIERMRYKIHKMEYINRMIGVVLQYISQHKRDLLYMKYKKKYSLQKISMQLNVSLATLNLWDRKILDFIAHIIFYKIEKEELNIYNLEMLGGFIEVLSDFIQKLENDTYNHLIANAEFLSNLKSRRAHYMRYYILGVHRILNTRGIVRKILEEKMNDHEITTKEIASKYGLSRSSVSWYLLSAKID